MRPICARDSSAGAYFNRMSDKAAGRNTPSPAGHFDRNAPGRGHLAVFPRCSLDPYDSDMGTSLAP
jgi:hypothetical protein